MSPERVERKLAAILAADVAGYSQMFMELPLAVAVPKGKRVDLVTRLNVGIAAVRADGAWQRINEQWQRQ